MRPLGDLDESRDGFTREHYKLGWFIGTYRDQAMLHHFGGIVSFDSERMSGRGDSRVNTEPW